MHWASKGWALQVPAGTAAVLVLARGALRGWMAAPAAEPAQGPALTTPSGGIALQDWFGCVGACGPEMRI